MSAREFEAMVSVKGSRVSIPVPFDPNQAWGVKQRHHVRGTVNGITIRGPLGSDGENYFLSLGAAWRRDAQIDLDAPVKVVLSPEGPQPEGLAPDIAEALAADPGALAFFSALATFYRNNYVRWIESAKRPQTRATRISEMMRLLDERRKQR